MSHYPRSKLVRLSVIICFLALSLIMALVVLGSRIDIIDANTSFIQYPFENETTILISMTVLSRTNCSARLTLGNETASMYKVDGNGSISSYEYLLSPLDPGNYTLGLQAYNAIWSEKTSVSLVIPHEEESEYSWWPVHFPLRNQTFKRTLEVLLYVEGQDYQEVKEVIMYTLAFDGNRSDILEPAMPGTWRKLKEYPTLETYEYYFTIFDSLGRRVRYPASENFVFEMKDPPMSATEYILNHERSNGKWGPIGREGIDGLWWTYHSVMALDILGHDLGNELIRVPSGGLDPEGIGQQVQTRQVLGRDANVGTAQVANLQNFFKPWSIQEENTGYFGPPQLSWMFDSVVALGRINASIPNRDQVIDWLLDRRNPDGGWGNVVSSNASHLSFTYYALGILEELDAEFSIQPSLDFISSCANPDGGFGWEPGRDSDVKYTYQALDIMNTYDELRVNTSQLVDWLRALQNQDGGFSCKYGWPSDLESTYLAIASLDILGSLETPLEAPSKIIFDKKIDPGLGIYQAMFEAAGITWGNAESPGYIVDYAKRAGIDLLGLKTSNIDFVEECLKYSWLTEAGVDVVSSEEKYGSSVILPPLGTYSHVANTIGRSRVKFFDEEFWDDFMATIRTLHDAGGIIHLQNSYSPEFSMAVLDDSISSGSGYDMISFDYRGEPWSERYWGVVPIIYSADAHLDLWKTRSKYDRERTLFIAPNGTWEGFRDAVEKNRVVRVRIASRENPDPQLMGDPLAVDFVRDRVEEWCWWLSDDTFPIFFEHIITRDNSWDALYSSPMDSYILPEQGGLIRIYNSTEIVAVWVDDIEYEVDSIDSTDFWSPYLVSSIDVLESGVHEMVIWYRDGAGLRKYERTFRVS